MTKSGVDIGLLVWWSIIAFCYFFGLSIINSEFWPFVIIFFIAFCLLFRVHLKRSKSAGSSQKGIEK